MISGRSVGAATEKSRAQQGQARHLAVTSAPDEDGAQLAGSTTLSLTVAAFASSGAVGGHRKDIHMWTVTSAVDTPVATASPIANSAHRFRPDQGLGSRVRKLRSLSIPPSESWTTCPTCRFLAACRGAGEPPWRGRPTARSPAADHPGRRHRAVPGLARNRSHRTPSRQRRRHRHRLPAQHLRRARVTAGHRIRDAEMPICWTRGSPWRARGHVCRVAPRALFGGAVVPVDGRGVVVAGPTQRAGALFSRSGSLASCRCRRT
jgi:hypothetical protein